jgi:hypothetical protein
LRIFEFSIAVLALALLTACAAPALAQGPSGSKFLDPEDGWFDMSAFLDMRGGFVPLAVPVTEPAVGYGVGGGLVFTWFRP